MAFQSIGHRPSLDHVIAVLSLLLVQLADEEAVKEVTSWWRLAPLGKVESHGCVPLLSHKAKEDVTQGLDFSVMSNEVI
jgi:hypothetical protein